MLIYITAAIATSSLYLSLGGDDSTRMVLIAV